MQSRSIVGCTKNKCYFYDREHRNSGKKNECGVSADKETDRRREKKHLIDKCFAKKINDSLFLGKSQIWKVLNRTYQNQKRKPVAVDLNPKAVTNDELFGIINPATREWK